MPIDNATVLAVVKSYQQYRENLAKKLNLDEIRRIEELQRVKDAAQKAATEPKPPAATH